jgi:hypothetical protein
MRRRTNPADAFLLLGYRAPGRGEPSIVAVKARLCPVPPPIIYLPSKMVCGTNFATGLTAALAARSALPVPCHQMSDFRDVQPWPARARPALLPERPITAKVAIRQLCNLYHRRPYHRSEHCSIPKTSDFGRCDAAVAGAARSNGHRPPGFPDQLCNPLHRRSGRSISQWYVPLCPIIGRSAPGPAFSPTRPQRVPDPLPCPRVSPAVQRPPWRDCGALHPSPARPGPAPFCGR